MSGFTTTTTLAVLINKRPINKIKRIKKSFIATQTRSLKAKQRLLKLS